MNLVPAAVALACAPFLFLVPGLLFVMALPARTRALLRTSEGLWLAVAASVCAAAWLGLLLAEIGRFSLATAGVVLALLSAVVLAASWRRLGRPWGETSWRDLAPAGVVLLVAGLLFARPSEYVVGGRDPGAYIAAMGTIARTGAIIHTDPAVLSIPREDVELFYRNIERPGFSWSRFMGFDLESPFTGRVVPQFFHLFPVFGAYLFQAMGERGALATPPLFSILAAVGIFLTFRRLLGTRVALVGSLLLVTDVVQVWFARYPVSETVSQFLMFAGLFAVVLWEEDGAPALGALAGFAFSLSLLVRIDSVLVLLPLALYLAVRVARGRLAPRAALAFVVPLLVVGAHAAVHAALFAPKYVRDILERPYWRMSAIAWVFLAVTAFMVAALAWNRRRALGDWLDAQAPTVRRVAAVVVVVLAVYALTLRPLLSAWGGGDGNDPQLSRFAVWGAALSARFGNGLLRALGFRRLAAHDAQALFRLGWFTTHVALALGVAGCVRVIRREGERVLLLVLTALSFAAFYFYKIRVYNDYYFALRRYLPVVLPCLLAFAAVALVALWARGGWRRVAAVALLAWVAFGTLRQTWPLLRPPAPLPAPYVDWRGAVRFVGDVARRFGPDDIVIFEQPQSIHLLSLPLWAAHGVNILQLARFDPDPERLRHLVDAWRGTYRNIYFVHTYRTNLCGLFLQHVEDASFGTYEWERAYGRPPQGPVFQALHFTISRVVPPRELRVPALDQVDVGGSDDFQVSGFFDKESVGPQTYRWTGTCGSIYVPGAEGAREVVVTAAAGRRPSPATVRVSLSGVPLGQFEVGPEFTSHTLLLPQPLPPGDPVLRFDTSAFRPGNVLAGSTDTRDLGIMVDRVDLRR